MKTLETEEGLGHILSQGGLVGGENGQTREGAEDAVVPRMGKGGKAVSDVGIVQ